MTERRRYKPYAWEPLTMTRAEVAEVVFRRSESWFIANTPEGFPAPVDGLYAAEAVREWVRARYGLAPAVSADQDWERYGMERARGEGKGAYIPPKLRGKAPPKK